MKPNETIVYYINRVYAKNLTTTSGGNLSVMDSEGNIWITPSGKDKGTLKEEDICCVRPDGTVIGDYKPSIELPFHTLIYKLRPDVKAVLHVHSPMLVTYSLFNRAPLINILPGSYNMCGRIGLSRYDIPGSIELGRQIADVIKDGYDSIMMENHGVVLVAKDMATAYDRLETLENAAAINIKARMLSDNINTLTVKDMKIALRRPSYDYTVRTEADAEENALRKKICEFARRCYVHDFFTVAGGTISARLNENTFLITPNRYDRSRLRPQQIVKVTDGKCEKGKRADSNYRIHMAIYNSKDYVNSIFTCTPPNIMAYAVTGEPINSRTIPESYINMRDIVRLPYATEYTDINTLTAALSPATPIALIDNSELIATGESIVKAFDRVEVTEVTAKTLILSRALGEPTNISDSEIDKIDRAFNLPSRM